MGLSTGDQGTTVSVWTTAKKIDLNPTSMTHTQMDLFITTEIRSGQSVADGSRFHLGVTTEISRTESSESEHTVVSTTEQKINFPSSTSASDTTSKPLLPAQFSTASVLTDSEPVTATAPVLTDPEPVTNSDDALIPTSTSTAVAIITSSAYPAASTTSADAATDISDTTYDVALSSIITSTIPDKHPGHHITNSTTASATPGSGIATTASTILHVSTTTIMGRLVNGGMYFEGLQHG